MPKKPGVYILKAAGEKILYVGKAKDLRARMGSYFRKSAGLDARKAAMVSGVKDFSYIVTDNELEALALEANLIKRHRPRFNVILRDDKNYPYLRLTVKEQWPRLEVVRRVARDGAMYFGPYVPSAGMREALDFIRRHFGVRTCKYRLDKPMRPCIQHQMGRCPAPCDGRMGREEYMRAVDEAVLFLKGKRGELLEDLEGKMQGFSGELRFEEAARVRDRIAALKRVWETQKVISPELGDMDVLGIHGEGRDAVLQVFLVRGGIMVGARDFYLRGVLDMPEGELLHDFILNFYSGAVVPPEGIAVWTEPADAANLADWLRQRRGGRVRIFVPRRGKRLALLRLARKNARHLYEGRRAKGFGPTMEELRERLDLRETPGTIGAFDISTLSGSESVGAFVCWEDGEFRKDLYRHMRIKGVRGIDDYAMMKEAVRRVFDGMEPPDLVVIDGGRAHLEAAVSAARGLREPPEMVAVAKKPDRAFTYFAPEPLDLEDARPSSLLLKRIRDEVHRFAVRLHRKLRDRRLMESPLDGVPGVGKKRRLELLKHFGSLEAVKSAGVEEIASVPGMNRKVAGAVREALSKPR